MQSPVKSSRVERHSTFGPKPTVRLESRFSITHADRMRVHVIPEVKNGFHHVEFAIRADGQSIVVNMSVDQYRSVVEAVEGSKGPGF